MGTFVAWAMVLLGLMRTFMGLYVAVNFEGAELAAATRRYIGSGTTGEAMDNGIMIFIAGIVLGLLVEIAKK